jgi:hypothetical protein
VGYKRSLKIISPALEAGEIAEDKPHGKLPPVSEGENTNKKINIPLFSLNPHSEERSFFSEMKPVNSSRSWNVFPPHDKMGRDIILN